MARLLILYFAFIPLLLGAKDFGTQGTLFTVQEESLLELIKRKLLSLDGVSIDTTRALTAIRNPKGISLPTANSYRSFTYDPSIVVGQDIKDREGQIIVAKGTRHNPLASHPLSSTLLLFDGRDEEQLNWAKSEQGLWILTQGSPLEIEEQTGIPTYFDQNGVLSQKLGIQAIPAKVTQEKHLLKIEEIPLPRLLTYQKQPLGSNECI